MPVARGPQVNTRSAVIVGISGVVVALVIGAIVVWLASSSDRVEIQLGDADFNAGRSDRIAEEIADRGPILYEDVGSGGSRDIYLQHIGADPDTNWYAFAVRRPEDPRACFLAWETGARQFTLTSVADDVSCDPDVVVDEVGTGLVQYPVAVVDGDIRVDLNFEDTE